MLCAESKRFSESSPAQPFSKYLPSYQDHKNPHNTFDPRPSQRGERHRSVGSDQGRQETVGGSSGLEGVLALVGFQLSSESKEVIVRSLSRCPLPNLSDIEQVPNRDSSSFEILTLPVESREVKA